MTTTVFRVGQAVDDVEQLADVVDVEAGGGSSRM